ncbi:MAG: enoyl-CoA hydratase/isomerase family protein [Anaerolineales bacterium]|jgi:enoyl-CoA hydratase
MTPIEYAVDRLQIATLTFNRPAVRNALDWDAMERFARAIRSLDQDAPRALILTGAEGSFCAGGDLPDLHPHATEQDGRRLAELMGQALDQLERLPFPTLAAIEGAAVGGGAEIAFACDLRVMAEDASLQMAQVRLGIMPGWGGGQRLLRAAGYSRAFYWLATGQPIHASQALASGLANEVTPPGKAYTRTFELARDLASYNPDALKAIKTALQGGLEKSPAEAMALERSLFPDLWASPAHHQAAEALIEKLRHADD